MRGVGREEEDETMTGPPRLAYEFAEPGVLRVMRAGCPVCDLEVEARPPVTLAVGDHLELHCQCKHTACWKLTMDGFVYVGPGDRHRFQSKVHLMPDRFVKPIP